MYKELDDLLSEESTIDSWYDDGFLIAQDIMTNFLKEDWEELSENVLHKHPEWQKKLVYCLDHQIIEEEIAIINKLFDTEDEELLEMCIDALRSFDNELGHTYINRHPEIIEMAEKKMHAAGNATKRMLQNFLTIFK